MQEGLGVIEAPKQELRAIRVALSTCTGLSSACLRRAALAAVGGAERGGGRPDSRSPPKSGDQDKSPSVPYSAF